jgi:hypothetical protein
MTAEPQIRRELDSLSASELEALFATLSAPGMIEMSGEYAGRILKQHGRPIEAALRLVMYSRAWPGRWRGKAFRPISDEFGVGYNYFERRYVTARRFPMRTLIGPSSYDNRPAFHAVYAAYTSLLGAVNMLDEIRRVDDGRYLVLSTAGFGRLKLQTFYALEGPTRAYYSDIGKPKKGGFRKNSYRTSQNATQLPETG